MTDVTRVLVEMPPIGGKAFVVDRKGVFVLEECPGTLRTIACTHAGAGAFEALDGVPDDSGYFPDEQMEEPEPPPAGADDDVVRGYVESRKRYDSRNGRPLFQANPAVMGSWMTDAGFLHGLTIRALSGHESVSTVATVVWMPYRQRVKP